MTTKKTKFRMTALLAALAILAASFPALAEGIDENVTNTIQMDITDVTETSPMETEPELIAAPESPAEAEPAEDIAPVAEPEFIMEPELTGEAVPATEQDLISEPELTEEAVCAAETDFAAEPVLTEETTHVAEAASSAEPELIPEPELTGETAPAAETAPVAEQELTGEAAPVAEPESAAEQEPAAEAENAVTAEPESSDAETEAKDEYEDFTEFPIIEIEEFEDGNGGNVNPELLEPFDTIANAERIPFSGSAEIRLKNTGMIQPGDQITLLAVLQDVNMDCRVVWEASNSDERGWFAVGNGMEYSYTLTAENMTWEYRVVLFTAN